MRGRARLTQIERDTRDPAWQRGLRGGIWLGLLIAAAIAAGLGGLPW